MEAQCDPTQTNGQTCGFLADKDKLIGSAGQIKAVAMELDNHGATSALDGLMRELDEERFYLAVLGSFKRGKSTFINALIGYPVLPTGVVPLTSVVTKLGYGDRTDVTVRFLDGRSSSIEIPELDGYITERGNPGNVKGVSEVEILFDSPYLREGVVLVDTPGIGSTYQGNTRTTHEFLSNLDAAIVIIGSDPPVSQGELDFIQTVRGLVETIFFVQNKIDRMTEDEWREALAFSRSVIHGSLGADVELFPLSSKRALEAKRAGDGDALAASGFLAFEAELGRFIAEDKGRVLLRSYGAKMERVLSDLQTGLDLELRVLNESGETLERKVAWLKDETGSVKRKMDEVDYLIDGGVDQITRRLDDALASFKKERGRTMLDDLDTFLDGLDTRMGPREFTDALEGFMSEAIRKAYEPFICEQEKGIAASFDALVRRFEKEAEAIEERLRADVSAAFEVEVRGHPPLPSRIGKSRFRFDNAEMLNYNSVIPAEMPFLLPKPLFRKAMKKKAFAMIETEIDKHGGKLRYDIVYRLSENARVLKLELRSRLLATLQTMNDAVRSGMTMRERTREERRSRAEAVGALKARLDAIGSDLLHAARSPPSPVRR